FIYETSPFIVNLPIIILILAYRIISETLLATSSYSCNNRDRGGFLMSEIKLILSDIDGTILNDENVIDTGLKAAVKQLRQKDVPFVLASARSPEGMKQIAADLDVLDNPIACYNGALVVKDLQNKNYTTILNHELDVLEVKKMFTILNQEFPEIS